MGIRCPGPAPISDGATVPACLPSRIILKPLLMITVNPLYLKHNLHLVPNLKDSQIIKLQSPNNVQVYFQ